MTHMLAELVLVFALSVGVILVCHRFKVPTIVGFLLTGVAAGPSCLGLVGAVEEVEHLSEVGVVLLMFSIGLELSGGELARLRKQIMLGGGVQVGATVALFAGAALLGGQSPGAAVFLGLLACLSSTAIVLKLYQARAELEAPHGRVTLSILILQDILVAPMVLAVPMLAGSGGSGLSSVLPLVKGVALVAVALVLARRVVPFLLSAVVRTRSRELFLVSVLALGLMAALAANQLGLSLSLGAFLAGLILAESEYSLSALEGVLPFRDVFTSLFFISVGMLLDMSFVIHHLPAVIGLALSIIVLKTLPAGGAAVVLGYPLRTALLAGLGLAQIGEFSFVLAKSGLEHGLIGPQGHQYFLAASILTMCLTPVLLALGPRLARRLPLPSGGFKDACLPSAQDQGLEDHLVIIGFGLGGRHLSRAARRAGIPYQILEMNPDTVRQARGEGEPITYGDAVHPDLLRHLGVPTARVLAVVISDPAAVRGVVQAARSLNPTLHILVRTRFLSELEPLREAGADEVVPEELETSVEIFTRVLSRYLVPLPVIEQFMAEVRSENYAMLRRPDLAGDIGESLGASVLGLEVGVLMVEPGSDMAGKTLREADLRRRHGLTVVALARENGLAANPDGDARLAPGWKAYVLGSRQAIADKAYLFAAPHEA
jgi:CPA2 family monovalent cation:H+ antiporter-2